MRLHALTRRAFAASCAAVAAVFCLGLAAGAVRLLPWIWADDVPLALTVPFAKELMIGVAEVSLLVGVPLGWALGTAAFVEEGQARALLALGASPLRLIRPSLPIVAAWAFGLGGVACVPRAAPGRLASALVSEARRSCPREKDRAVRVPLVGVTWLCPRAGKPRIVGRVPGRSQGWWFSASSLRPSDDLGRVDLAEFELFVPPKAMRWTLNLSAGTATMRGLPRWGIARGLPVMQRAVLLGASLGVLSLVAAHRILAIGLCSRLLAAVLALAGPMAILAGLRGLEKEPGLASIAWVSLPLGIALSLALGIGMRRLVARAR